MTRLLENYLPPVNEDGILTAKVITTSAALTAGSITTAGTLTSGAQTVTGGVTASGTIIAEHGNTVPATAGAVAAGIPIQLFSDGPSIYVTSDAPTHTAVKGSLCINTAGNSASTRLYVNDGTTNWVAVTTAS